GGSYGQGGYFQGGFGGQGSYGGYGQSGGGFGGGMTQPSWRGGQMDQGQRGWRTDDRSVDRGLHTGKGPKGYRRSDDRIREEVCDALTRDPGVDASSIDVKVDNGEITLGGTVDDRHQKRMAETVVERVEGVKDVHNQIRVQSQSQHGLGLSHGGPSKSGEVGATASSTTGGATRNRTPGT
ncbi:MAG: BON domain-containing protein, partial [Myxococcota bacterium]